MGLFWDKLIDKNVPAIDLLWYFYEDYGTDATLWFADWCFSLIRDEKRRRTAEGLSAPQLSNIIPEPIILVQHAWRALMREGLGRIDFLESTARDQMKRLAEMLEQGEPLPILQTQHDRCPRPRLPTPLPLHNKPARAARPRDRADIANGS